MYTPPAFREDDLAVLRQMMRAARLATLVTATADGLLATPLPLFIEDTEGSTARFTAMSPVPIRIGASRRSSMR